MTPARAGVAAAGLLLLLACQGCGSLGQYGQDRLRDLSDILDVRYGTGLGLGSQIRVLWLETGFGLSTEAYYRQWFGRKSVEVRRGLFAQAVVAGIDGDYWRRKSDELLGNSSTGSFSVLVVNVPLCTSFFSGTGSEDWFEVPAGDPPLWESFRIGGVVFLPGVSGGLFLNLGEVVDFLGGVVGWDPLHDDGIPKFRLIPEGDPDVPPAEQP
ncbi:MAG TPA: hypothetical protein VFY71_15870 [Planctomycetota bacterium]|nr:hypothetical protein [Planctomycetota bacterium]